MFASASCCCIWCTVGNRLVVISAVLSFDKYFSHRNTFCAPKFCYQCTVVLIGTSLSGYALLNFLRTAGNYFDRIQVVLVNTPSLHLHSYCAAVASSGQAAEWLWVECYGASRDSLLHGGGRASCFWFRFCKLVFSFSSAF